MPDSDRCVYALHDYLPSFHQLKTLQFNALNMEPTIPEHLTLFSTFQHTLSSLYLSGVLITWSSFVALLGYFPHLRDLYISEPSLRVDEWPVPQIPHPLRGKLCISLSDKGAKPFTDRFPELRQEYEELEMLMTFGPCLIAAAEGSLKYLWLLQRKHMLLQLV